MNLITGYNLVSNKLFKLSETFVSGTCKNKDTGAIIPSITTADQCDIANGNWNVASDGTCTDADTNIVKTGVATQPDCAAAGGV